MDTIRAYGYQSRFALMSDSRVDYNHRYGLPGPGQGLSRHFLDTSILIHLALYMYSVAPESTQQLC